MCTTCTVNRVPTPTRSEIWKKTWGNPSHFSHSQHLLVPGGAGRRIWHCCLPVTGICASCAVAWWKVREAASQSLVRKFKGSCESLYVRYLWKYVWEHSLKIPDKEILRRKNKVLKHATTWMNLKTVSAKEARRYRPHVVWFHLLNEVFREGLFYI